MQDLNALEGKSIAELREIAKVLGIADTTLRKKALMAEERQEGMKYHGAE